MKLHKILFLAASSVAALTFIITASVAFIHEPKMPKKFMK